MLDRIDLERIPSGDYHSSAISRSVRDSTEGDANGITEGMVRLYVDELLRRGMDADIIRTAFMTLGGNGEIVYVQEPAHAFDQLVVLEDWYSDQLSSINNPQTLEPAKYPN